MPQNTPNHPYIFCDLAKEWYQGIGMNVKLSTRIKYHNMLTNYALPLLGHLPVDGIGYVEMEHFVRNLLTSCGNQGNGLAHKTVSDILIMVRSILRYAQRKGYPTSNDVFSYQMKMVHKPIRVFSLSEQERLCQMLYENMSILNLGILFTLFTGLRIGELCALQWKDISFEDRTVRVNKTMQRIQTLDTSSTKTKIMISSPKTTNAIRLIPIAKNLIPILEAYRREPETFFLADSTREYAEPRLMQRHFKKVLSACEISDGSFHTLRHTFATRCVEMNFDIKSLSEILGHCNVSITMNRYVHPSMELKRKNIEKLSPLLDNQIFLNKTKM